MMTARNLLLIGGLLAFLVAGLSIGDMFRTRPFDGVILEADAPTRLVVRDVVPGSGADVAGIQPGDEIFGIDRNMLRSPAHAAELLNERRVGEKVPYLLRGLGGELREVLVELGLHRIGNLPYLYACLLGFLFFFIGLFVLERQPRQRAAQIFFMLCALFFVFLVCRLRPASYTWVDTFVLRTGTAALLFLPATFLHFFLIFPLPVRLRPERGDERYAQRRRNWLGLLSTIYLLPLVVLMASLARVRVTDPEAMLRHSFVPAADQIPLGLISGAPAPNWWVLALYVLLGLSILAVRTARQTNPRLRRGGAAVLFGSLFGLLPFLVTAVAFPSFLQTEKFLYYGVGPLVLVPLTFAWAIVVFRLLEVRVILRKSLLYTATTAIVTAFYALGIALFNFFTRGTSLAASPYFPIVFALVIILLFDPLRRRVQVLVDRFIFAERGRLEEALDEMGEAVRGQVDLQPVVRDLVDTLPQRLGLHFVGLYLVREDTMQRVAGPSRLPLRLPVLPRLQRELEHRRGLTTLDEVEPLAARERQVATVVDSLSQAGVRVLGGLASPRRSIGLAVFSEKVGQFDLDPSELLLLRRLLDQVSLALETSLLLEERTRQAELERELEIASSVQTDLLPSSVRFSPGWTVAALCQPARHVGGDFFTELPGPEEGSYAVVYGDVAGKSVSGALVMMAAHEVLNSLALTHRDPETLMELANRRLYGLGRRKSFVAIAYLAPAAAGLAYLLAGQPQPLLRRHSGDVVELGLPDNRIPLGALNNGRYQLREVPMERGDLVLGYSDGVVEAQSPAGELFGSERLAEIVAGGPEEPRQMVDHVMGALSEFTSGTEPYDDLTLVAVRCDREVM